MEHAMDTRRARELRRGWGAWRTVNRVSGGAGPRLVPEPPETQGASLPLGIAFGLHDVDRAGHRRAVNAALVLDLSAHAALDRHRPLADRDGLSELGRVSCRILRDRDRSGVRARDGHDGMRGVLKVEDDLTPR